MALTSGVCLWRLLTVFVCGIYSRKTVADFRHIAIEGPPAVGKSLLADRLGARIDAAMMLDEAENPFLAEFYAGRAGSAFQAQLFFTLARHRQQIALRQTDLFSQVTVCDYLFERDKVYAYLNLDDNELFIYQRLYELLAQDVLPPDLVIFLQSPTDVLRRRLKERGRANPPGPRSARGHALRVRSKGYIRRHTSLSQWAPRRDAHAEVGSDRERASAPETAANRRTAGRDRRADF